MFKAAFLFLGLAIEALIMHNALARWFSMEEPISFIATFVFATCFVVFLIIAIIKKVR